MMNDHDQHAGQQRRIIPGVSVLLATISMIIMGFVFTVGCTIFSLTRAGGRTERELEAAILYIGVPLVVAGLCLYGAWARYRGANRI